MMNSAGPLIGMAAVAILALAAWAGYRWRQRGRVRRVGDWVREYLLRRYGEAPNDLHVNCSDDTSWPVLVSFTGPRTGIRHELQFSCGRPPSPFVLLSETEGKR